MKTTPTTIEAQGTRPAYLRKADAARYLSVSLRTVSDWASRGIIPHLKPCRKVCLFAVADLDRAMQRFRVEAVGDV